MDFRPAIVRCPECGHKIGVDARKSDGRFILPRHGATKEMDCRGSDRPMRLTVAK
jgi:DNA-directed RNA polymerase subunit RPC12/RpoP